MLGKDDTDNLGCFVQYRIAFYVAGGQGLTRHPTISKLLRCCCRVVVVVLIWFSGSLENFFLFFDGYLQYKSKQFARATPFEVNVHPHMGVDLSGLKETLTYKPIEFLDPAAALPLKWYEAHPVVGNRILCFHFEAEDDNILHLVITGNTWLYRDDLERHLLVVGVGRSGVHSLKMQAWYRRITFWGRVLPVPQKHRRHKHRNVPAGFEPRRHIPQAKCEGHLRSQARRR